jgi:hypothetical protein
MTLRSLNLQRTHKTEISGESICKTALTPSFPHLSLTAFHCLLLAAEPGNQWSRDTVHGADDQEGKVNSDFSVL